LRKLFNKDFVDKYTGDPAGWAPCQTFKEGQSWVVSEYEPWECPPEFCGWAWADIQKIVWGMSRGGPRLFVTCCTDGFRPVFFLLERITV